MLKFLSFFSAARQIHDISGELILLDLPKRLAGDIGYEWSPNWEKLSHSRWIPRFRYASPIATPDRFIPLGWHSRGSSRKLPEFARWRWFSLRNRFQLSRWKVGGDRARNLWTAKTGSVASAVRVLQRRILTALGKEHAEIVSGVCVTVLRKRTS